jgi:hypothetical protein
MGGIHCYIIHVVCVHYACEKRRRPERLGISILHCYAFFYWELMFVLVFLSRLIIIKEGGS